MKNCSRQEYFDKIRRTPQAESRLFETINRAVTQWVLNGIMIAQAHYTKGFVQYQIREN